MENNQNQETNDFFAAMQNENKEKQSGSNFSKSSLLPGETILASAEWQITPIIVILSIAAFILWTLFIFYVSSEPHYEYNHIAWAMCFPYALISTLFIIIVLIAIKYQEFVITNKRVIAYYGFIWRTAFELKIEQVESITIYQGLFDRLFHCGTVKVCGVGASKAWVFFVKDPFEFRQHFFDLQYAEKNNTID